MNVDYTIPVWNIIIAVVFLVTIVARMAKMETKVDTMWSVFCKTNGIERRNSERKSEE